jgi:hypothetical protein
MRYPASEKLEIIRIVEQSHLSVTRTLDKLGIPKTTFYRWYDRYLALGEAGLDDRSPHPGRVWNRIPDDVRDRIVQLALDEPELSPRELAVRFTDTKKYFVSEASVYRILKAHDLITSPAFIVIKAADEFKDKTTAPNELWQTDFTRGLEALHQHEGRRCHRHPGTGPGSLRLRQRHGSAQAEAAVRQRFVLHLP